MKTAKLLVKVKNQKYSVVIGSNIINKLSQIFRHNSINSKKFLLLIDNNLSANVVLKIKKSFKNKKILILFFKASEMNKNQKIVNKITKLMLKENFSRDDSLISIGGGITGDVGGFAASIFKRGLNFINIPTTLLSQVDSSIGGKTGFNTEYGKNLIGSFYQPKLVVSDTNFLKTLPEREIICGYAEILKHSLIANKTFFKFLDVNVRKILKLKSPYIEKVIFESCKIKKIIVEQDEKEKNLRKILNFGHTFAHAYEASLDYSKKLNHGEAVILGMNSALNFSLTNKLIKKTDYNLIINHIKKLKLTFNLDKFFSKKDIKKILSFMIKDKKNNSEKINLVLLKEIGSSNSNHYFSVNYLKSFLKKELTD